MTGATGYLGSHILAQLLCNGHVVYCLKRQKSSLEHVRNISFKINWIDLEIICFQSFFSKHKIELILHCATDYCREQPNPVKAIETNLLLPLKILEAAIAQDVICFMNTDTVLDSRLNDYSLSKNQFTQWLNQYSEKIAVVNVALEHFYGPNDADSKFVTKMIYSLLRNAPEIPLTKGFQKRDFIYIDDVVSAFITLINSYRKIEDKFSHYEVGTGIPIEVRELIMLAKRLSNNNFSLLDFGAIPYRENEVMSSFADTTGLRKLGWQPKISIEQGLLRTINIDRKGM